MPRRIRVKDYATLSRDSELLVAVPSAGGPPQRLHWRAAAGFTALAEAVRSALGLELRAASGWRPHRWSSRSEYEATLVRRYGSTEEGRRWLAFDSPHETGLAVDIGVGGLWPDRKTVKQQRESALHRWLVEHAAEFGWSPYPVEPWHWEYPVDPSLYWTPAAADAPVGGPTIADTACGYTADTEDMVCEAEEGCASDAPAGASFADEARPG